MAKQMTDDSSRKTSAGRSSSARIRVILARVVWAVCVFCASVLAVAALLIAVDAESGNPLVELVLDVADGVDLGIFGLDNPIKEFTGDNGETTTALFNYGLGAIAYLLVGRLLDRLIRP